ncbi:MAG: hypothetical protein ACK4N5_12630, partial [Myxococcales bacterium]
MRSLPLLVAALLAAAPAAAAELRPQVSLAWFGETLLHPGGRLGADVTVLGGARHRLLLGADLGVYHHRGFHTGVLLDAVAGY